jgi:transposase
MPKSLGQPKTFVGVDVSERRLDVHLLPAGESAGFANDPGGIGRLVAWLGTSGRLLVVVEATGGLERPLAAALALAGLAVAVVNPRQIRDFARSGATLPIRAPGQDRPMWTALDGQVSKSAASAGVTQ